MTRSRSRCRPHRIDADQFDPRRHQPVDVGPRAWCRAHRSRAQRQARQRHRQHHLRCRADRHAHGRRGPQGHGRVARPQRSISRTWWRSRAVHTADELGRKAAELNRIVSQHTDGFAELIDTKQNQLTNALGAQTNLLRAALEQNCTRCRRPDERVHASHSARGHRRAAQAQRRQPAAAACSRKLHWQSCPPPGQTLPTRPLPIRRPFGTPWPAPKQAGKSWVAMSRRCSPPSPRCSSEFGEISGKLRSETEGFTTAAATSGRNIQHHRRHA